jgi:hypothetical protein
VLEEGPPEDGAPVAEPDPVPPVEFDPALAVEPIGCVPLLIGWPVEDPLEPAPAEAVEPEAVPVVPPFAAEPGLPLAPVAPGLVPPAGVPAPVRPPEPESLPAAGAWEPSAGVG